MVRGALRVVPWVVVGAVMLVLCGVAVQRLFLQGPLEPDDAESVEDVADLAARVAEDLDVPAGVDLLCEAPMPLYRMALDTRIEEWQDRSGTERPDMDYAVSDVDDEPEGSFLVDITSDEPGLEDEATQLRVFVVSRDGRSCIVGVGDADDTMPDQDLSGEGYDGARSPAPAPTPTPSGTP